MRKFRNLSFLEEDLVEFEVVRREKGLHTRTEAVLWLKSFYKRFHAIKPKEEDLASVRNVQRRERRSRSPSNTPPSSPSSSPSEAGSQPLPPSSP